MRRIKIFNILFIVLFIGIIVSPILFINMEPNKISTIENRTLAQFPDIKINGKVNSNFINEFEAWFNDNLGFRDKIAIINNKLQYRVFGKLNRENTFIGKNGWLFFMYPNMIEEYQNMTHLTEENLRSYLNKYQQINNYLDAKGIPMMVAVAPTKENIYPEYMPETILRKENNSRADDIVKYVRENSNLDFFSLKQELVNAKQHGVVYSKNCDMTHWNRRGSLVGYFKLIEEMRRYLPDLKALHWEDFVVEDYERSGQVISGIDVKELDTKYTLSRKYTAKLDNTPLQQITIENSPHLTYRYANSDINLPKLLIMGDSFIYQFILPELAESFSEVTFLHLSNLGDIKKYTEIFEPDMVLIEAMEPAVTQIKDDVNYREDYFDEYSKYKKLPIETTPLQTNWVDYIDGQMLDNQGSWVIDSKRLITRIEGWAIDPIGKNIPGQLYLQIGDKYYSAQNYQQRQSVVEVLGDPNYLYSGFTFEVKTEDLIDAKDKIRLIIISHNKRTQYMGNSIQIVIP